MKPIMDDDLRLLLDERAIRRVLCRYTRGIDRVAPELIESAYHEHSWDDHGPFAGTGREFARDSPMASARFGDANVVAHHLLGQSLIDVDGDVALCETYFSVVRVGRQGDEFTEYRLVGRYLDRFERADGKWLIRARRVVMDQTSQQPLPDPAAAAKDFPQGRRWPDDPVFHLDTVQAPRD